jgi:hypothetical protein
LHSGIEKKKYTKLIVFEVLLNDIGDIFDKFIKFGDFFGVFSETFYKTVLMKPVTAIKKIKIFREKVLAAKLTLTVVLDQSSRVA